MVDHNSFGLSVLYRPHPEPVGDGDDDLIYCYFEVREIKNGEMIRVTNHDEFLSCEEILSIYKSTHRPISYMHIMNHIDNGSIRYIWTG